MLDEVALIRVRDLKAGEHGEIYSDLERDMHGPATILVIVNETPGIPVLQQVHPAVLQLGRIASGWRRWLSTSNTT